MDIELTDEQRIKIHRADDLYGIMQKILEREQKIDQNREHFWVVGLETNQRLLFIELISLGTVNKVLVEPMEVFSFALQKRAVKIVLVHNHPSGELRASEQDKDITDRLIQVGRIVDLPVEDHLIITDKSYMSFFDMGLMEQLKLSTKHVPTYELVERMEKAEKDAQKAKETAKKQLLKIAKELKKEGESSEKIAKLLGLSIEEVEGVK
jgi:DNA repair protein RadC